MKSVALQIQEYLERRTEWVNGGDLERMTFITEKGSRAKPSNISKRLRELSAAEKIRKDLGWKPDTTFKELVEKMVLNDLLLKYKK